MRFDEGWPPKNDEVVLRVTEGCLGVHDGGRSVLFKISIQQVEIFTCRGVIIFCMSQMLAGSVSRLMSCSIERIFFGSGEYCRKKCVLNTCVHPVKIQKTISLVGNF